MPSPALLSPARRPAGIVRLIGWLGVFLLIVLLPLPRHWVLWRRDFGGVYYELTSVALYLVDGAWALLAVAGLLAGPALWRFRPPPSALTNALLMLIGLATLSVVWAWDAGLALALAGRLALAGLLFWVVAYLRPPARLVHLALGLMLLIQVSVALAQFTRQANLGLVSLGEPDFQRYPGGGSLVIQGDRYWLRAYGLTPHPNILGGLLSVSWLLLAVPFLQSRRWAQAAWLVLLWLASAGLFLSFSRAAWLALLGGGLLLAAAIYRRPAWRRSYGRALATLAVTTIILWGGLSWRLWPLVATRLNPESGPAEMRSISERGSLAGYAGRLIRLAPLTGIGAGNFAVAVLPWAAESQGVAAQPVHNMPLLLWAELGPAGLALWLWLLAAPLWLSWRRWRQGRATLWLAGLAAALLAFGLIDWFDHYAWSWPQGRWLRWLLWALWVAALADERPAIAGGPEAPDQP